MNLLLASTSSYIRRGPAEEFLFHIRSLESRLDLADSKGKTKLLLAAAEAATSLGRYKEAEHDAKLATKAAESIGGYLLAKALTRHGKLLDYVFEDNTSAQPNIKRAISILKDYPEHSEDYLLAILGLLGRLAREAEIQQYESLCLKAETFARNKFPSNAFVRGRLHNAKGLYLWYDSRSSEAIECFKKAETIFRPKSNRWLGGVATNMGLAAVDLGKEKAVEAIEHCERALILHRIAQNPGWESVNAVAWARALMFSGAPRKALELLEKEEPLIMGIAYKENVALMLSLRGEIHFQLGNCDQAQSDLESALRMLKQNSDTRLIRTFRTSTLLAELSANKNDEESKLEYMTIAKKVIRARRITNNHPVWTVREMLVRYAMLAI